MSDIIKKETMDTFMTYIIDLKQRVGVLESKLSRVENTANYLSQSRPMLDKRLIDLEQSKCD